MSTRLNTFRTFLQLIPLLFAQSIFAQNVLTYHNDNARTGQNLTETTLTHQNVNSSQFGKLFSQSVDGQVYAQPLYMASVNIAGKGLHNVVFIATEHDGVYAFDADTNAGANANPLWQRSFISPPNVVPMSQADAYNCGQITPELGITSTPVIDPATNTMYLVATTKEISGSTTSFVHRVHALDITTGADKLTPVVVQAAVPGTGDHGTTVTFVPQTYKQRPGLLLLNGVVYTAWSSHCDANTYHGWLIGYRANDLAKVSVYNANPDGKEASFWNSGVGPAADAAGKIYIVSGNGTFDANTGGRDYGDSVIKLDPANQLTVSGYFAPFNQQSLSDTDADLGSGGAILLPDSVGSTTHPHLLVAAGKAGTVYVLDRDNLGGFHAGNDSQIVEPLIGAVGAFFSNPAYFNGSLYFSGSGDYIKAFGISGATVTSTPTSKSFGKYSYPGSTPTVSANGTSNGIVWAIENTPKLHAYDSSNLATELYNSGQNDARDGISGYVKYSSPTIANAKVYVGTANTVAVFGLLTQSCAYGILPNAQSYGSAATTDSVAVQTTAGCAWTAVSNSTWANVTAGSSGSGPGSVAILIAQNSGPQRVGTVTIAGQTFTITQAGIAATLSLSRSTVRFGVSQNGNLVTDPQVIAVSATGTINWTATSDKAFVTISPAAGTGNGGFTITVNGPATPANSTQVATITVAASGVSSQTITATVVASSTPGGPFGVIDTPSEGATGLAGALAITGWALDDVEVSDVSIYRNAVPNDNPASIQYGPGPSHGLVYVGKAFFLAGARPDVETAYPNQPLNYRAGWGLQYLSNVSLNNNGTPGIGGNGTYRFHAIATNKAGVVVELGSHSVTIDNLRSVLPFGTIDTPNMGEVVSGTRYVNFGWTLTPQPNTIPFDGSTIMVTIDGAFIGHPTYGQPRSDIDAAFPNYKNTGKAVGYSFIDTTQLTNGLHSIGWTVRDNVGNLQGVGSRVFYVQNNGGASSGSNESPLAPATTATLARRSATFLSGINQYPLAPATTGVFARRGWNPSAQMETIHSGAIAIGQMDRVELHFGRVTDIYQLVGDERRPLPIGSRFDSQSGIFYWQPPVGMLGDFHIAVRTEDGSQRILKITINPEQAVKSQVSNPSAER